MAIVMVACLLASCGESGDTTNVANLPIQSVIKKVALITNSLPIDDGAYNQACWEEVKAWCEPCGIEYTYYQPEEDSTDARVASTRQAIEEGANVIVMPGYLFGTTLIEVQEQYPDIYFLAIDVCFGDMTEDYENYYVPSPNTVCITFAEEQAGYLAGYATVKEGFTQLGFIGGMAVPAVIRYGYGFVQGADDAAKEMGVDIHIKYSYEGIYYCDGYQENLSKLKSWVENGTEIIFSCGGVNGPRYAKDMTIPFVVSDVDMAHISPNILTSAQKELKNAVEYALTALYEGRWETELGERFVNLTLQDGDYVGLPSTDESFRFQTFTMEEYEEIKADIRKGIRTVSSAFEYMPTVSWNTTVEEIG